MERPAPPHRVNMQCYSQSGSTSKQQINITPIKQKALAPLPSGEDVRVLRVQTEVRATALCVYRTTITTHLFVS
jgi:hypothetical protein